LGLVRVAKACEQIEEYGAPKDKSGLVEKSEVHKRLELIEQTLAELKAAYDTAVMLLKRFYGET
jgi:osomolarity two-component system phosphorelay intermediate protein YPD1